MLTALPLSSLAGIDILCLRSWEKSISRPPLVTSTSVFLSPRDDDDRDCVGGSREFDEDGNRVFCRFCHFVKILGTSCVESS